MKGGGEILEPEVIEPSTREMQAGVETVEAEFTDPKARMESVLNQHLVDPIFWLKLNVNLGEHNIFSPS